MVATSGARLISEEAVDVLKEELFPLADLLTPNIPETEVLTGRKIKNADDMIEAAKQVSEQYHCAVLCKGGHKLNDANDLLYVNGTYQWFEGKGSTIPIPTEQDVLFPRPSLPTLQRDFPWWNL